MSKNKQSMKLYTEEQVIEMIESSYLHGFERAHDYKDVKEHILKSVPTIKLQSVTTIKLPSDEYIEQEANLITDLSMRSIYILGAKWMRDKIQGGEQ